MQETHRIKKKNAWPRVGDNGRRKRLEQQRRNSATLI
jgi:hypothetical protein